MTESTKSVKRMTMMIGSLKRKRSLVTMTQMTIVIGNIRKRRNLINMIKIENLNLTSILEKVNRNIVKRIKTTIVRIRKSMKKNAIGIRIESIETRLVGLNIEKEIRTGIGRRTSMNLGKEIAQSRRKTMISTLKIVKETKKGRRRIKINQNTKISHLILTVSF